MKTIFQSLILIIMLATISTSTYSQTAKAVTSCKMYLEEKVVAEISVEDAIKWCELTPPTVLCDDGNVYKLENFQISYLTLKPFQSQDFGIGEGGFPIRARQAVKNGKSGDTIILKQVTYTDAAGAKQSLPVISLKLK